MKKLDYSLYLVTDRNLLCDNSLEKAVEDSILGGVTIVQLREKSVSTLEFYNIAVKIKAVTDKYKVPLIIDDRLDIALAMDAAGVHVGQSDMPAHIARGLIGKDRILGVSVHNVEEALKAERAGADYVGSGAVFPTGTKKDVVEVSIEELKRIKEEISIPVVAIGGISEDNAYKLSCAGIDGIAVVSAIIAKVDTKAAAENLKRHLSWIK